AAIDKTAPGVSLEDVHMAAAEVITEGLVKLGLVEGPTETAIAEGKYKKIFVHKTSHWLGMDVHDVGSYLRDGSARALEPGMVITVEPGVYVSLKDDKVEPRWRGIGIRIEDDVVVTPEGRRVLTHDIPKEVDELERLCST
ncbi:MAG: M24 family metallopeptidase, partial [Deltaproteobacteria bacterium]|nr:M24 family metallopeptidase [Deltaproteobacteria bacterium]